MRVKVCTLIIIHCLLSQYLSSQELKKVFFVPFKGGADTKSIVDLCNVTIQEDISRVPGFTVVDYADVAASLEMEGKNAKSCLEDIDCILASASSLGINVILYGKLSKDMDVINITLKMYDAVLGRIEREYNGKLSGETVEVANNTSKLVVALLSGAPMPSTEASTREIMATPASGGQATSTATTETTVKGKPRLYTWIALGAEAITLSAAITFNLLAKNVNDELHSAPHNKPDDMIKKGETYMTLAWIFYGLAAVSTGATIFFFYWERPKEEGTADIYRKDQYLSVSPSFFSFENTYTFGIKGRF
ncbi:MAG: hypothetical protein N2746_11070 [Deltaproteobacteria bacterium]|nr:hypothetical protein [Deltaproteobacteria bacterium]